MTQQPSPTLEVAQRLGRWQQREERLDRITRLARRVYDVAWTSITVLDDDHAWFPSAQGFDLTVLPHEETFCDRTGQLGRPLLVQDAGLDPRFASLPAVVEQGIRFYAGVPLRDSGGSTVGVFCLYDTRVRTLDDDEQQGLEDFAAWAEQELLASAEMTRAAQVQTSMLPAGPIRLDGWDIHGACLPALAVGGDLFDYAVSDDVLHVGLGDVMGKGTGAALLGAGVRAALRNTHRAVVAGVDLGVTVTQVARSLGPDLERAQSFVTLVDAAVDLDDGYLRYVDAGMGLGLVVRADGRVDRLTSDDLPIGVLSGDHWTERTTTIEPGDRLVLFSDGLLDLLDDQVEWWTPVSRMVGEHEDAGALLSDIAARTAAVRTMSRRLLVIRIVVVLTALLGVNYVGWRWLASVNWHAWWIGVPLVVAETYSLIDSLLFGLTMWRLRERGEPPAPPPDLTVDVLIATYNEPVDLVMRTARAAAAIRYPHRTWILDDGDRPELRAAAEREGIGWLTRTADWAGKARHAKAGNLNNALLLTEGEYLLILDADQVPMPEILDRTLGYLEDPAMALVQTPQWFVNVPADDPLGSQAPLFYGPIQQGKDGWNAAFFCGSNAVLRREALMQLGVAGYAGQVEANVRRALRTARSVLRQARRSLGPDDRTVREALDAIEYDVGRAQRELDRGDALMDVTYRFQQRVAAIRRELVAADLSALEADLAQIAALGADDDESAPPLVPEVLEQLSSREYSPLGAVATVQALVDAVDVDLGDEAQPIMPMATISVTEDMATCMRLHGLGWRTAYHDEVLAHGLAPEDLATMLTQRLRWAQGTVQVMFRENPLLQRRLRWGQRLMYFATMWSYLSGFAALVYLAAPVVYLTAGVLPVQALSTAFFLRLVPFLVVNQLLFLVVANGRPTWRGQQYSLALFPTWIKAFTSAFGNVFLGRSLDFAVTPKERRAPTGPAWHLVRPQLGAMAVLVVAAVVGVVRIFTGQANAPGTVFNLLWVGFDLAIFSVILKAARYGGHDATTDQSPTTARARRGAA